MTSSETLYLIGYIFLTFLFLSFIAWPLLHRQPLDASKSLEAEKAAYLLGSLRQLHADRAAGKPFSSDDFSRIERRLMLELAKNYQRLGVEPNLNNSGDSGSCSGCGHNKQPEFAFCPFCGTQQLAA